ncbi:MAG: thrombospondin type 3 repeat-containing protein [bacterium]|nr:thrombospondin type 3 repeat-containing protein [bacterium]
MRHRITLSIVFFVSLFLMLSPAYAGTVSLSPPFGPAGTTFAIYYSGNWVGADFSCSVNSVEMGQLAPYGGALYYTVPAGTPIGTTYNVVCGQNVPDQFDAGSAVFTVTAGDSDGDGVADDTDQCPSEFAQTQNGCPFIPDSDGDGVGDPTDQCLYVFGTLPNGCPPDSDGDGIGDPTDQCPFEAAQTANGCPNQPTNPPASTVVPVTQPDQPVVTPPSTVASFIDPNIAPALDAILAGCVDLRPQAERLSIGALMRLLGTSDPCTALTNALRDLSFGTLRDGEVKLIMDALGGNMRGTCGISPEVPSTEYLRMLRNAYRLFPTFAEQLNTAVMALASAADGTPERAIFCTFMAMDGAGMNRLFPSTLNDGHRFLIAAAECLPSYPEDADLFTLRSAIAGFSTYGYNAGMFLSAVNNPITHPQLCQIFAEWQNVITDITPEEEQLATHLIRDCRVNWLNLFVIDGTDPLSFGSAATAIQIMRINGTPDEIATLIEDLSCDSIYTNLILWKRRFEDAIGDLFGRDRNRNGNGGGFGNPQIPDVPDLGLGGNRFRVPSLIDLIGGTTLPRIYPPTTIAGFVFEDMCDESALELDFRLPLPAGCVEIGPRIVSSNNFWDEGEPPIGGIYIELINNDTCSGTPLYTTSPDATGYFEFPNLEAGNYSLVIDANHPENIPVLGAGEWSYRRGEGTRRFCIIYNLRGQTLPVTANGYNRTGGISSTGIGNFVIPPVFINIRQIDDGGEVSWRPPPIPPLEPDVPSDSEVSSDWRPPPIPPLTDFGIDNPSDVVSWRPPPIPPYEALVRGLAYAPPPNMNLRTAVDALSGALRWEDFSFEMDSRGLFIGIGNPEEPARLFMAQNGGIGEFDLPNTPLSIGMTPDGKLAGIIGENTDGSRVVSILNVENGFWIPVFTSTPDIIPTGDNPFFVAEYLYFSATDPNGAPGIYKVNPIAPSTPELVLNDATQGNITYDGVLLAFVRGGNVFVQNTNTDFIAQITNDGSCGSPIFDAVGFSLYFACGGKLYVYGLDGVKPIVDDIVVQSVSLGPVDGTLIFSDGQSAYLSDLNGANRRPFMRLSNLSVVNIRWQPPLPMPAPQS